MPIILQQGETMESQHRVSTRYGDGTLHVTGRALIVEIKRRGIVFHRYHAQMAGIEARGWRKIRLTWPEGSQLFDFEFKAGRQAGRIVEEIKKSHPYEANYSREGITRVIFTSAQRREIRKRREGWAAGRCGAAQRRAKGRRDDPLAAEEAESWRLLLLHNHKAAVVRSVRIPGGVEDHLCWNDSWFAARGWPGKGGFCTFNPYWLSGRYPKSPVRGARPDGQSGAYWIPACHVRFYHGYPYVRGDAFVDPIYEQGFMLPTMTEAMLDEDMMAKRHRPRERREAGLTLADGRPYSVLGYLTDHREAYSINPKLAGFSPSEFEYVRLRGLIPDDEAARGIGCRQPGQPEVERLLAADGARARSRAGVRFPHLC